MPIKRQPISGRTYACLCPNTIIKIIISHFVYNVKAISVNLCQMTRIFQKKSDIKKAKRTKNYLFAQPVEQDIELVKLYKKLREVALSKTFHRNVLEGKLAWVCKKGERSCTLPLDPATFEKVDETLTVGFICANFFVMLLFQQAERKGQKVCPFAFFVLI